MLFDYNSIRYLFYCVSLSDTWPGKRQGEKKSSAFLYRDWYHFLWPPFPFPQYTFPLYFLFKKIAKTKHCSVTGWEKELRHRALQVSDKNFHSWSRTHERTVSLRFLGIILKVLRLEVSVYNVHITNQFQAALLQMGKKIPSRGDCK